MHESSEIDWGRLGSLLHLLLRVLQSQMTFDVQPLCERPSLCFYSTLQRVFEHLDKHTSLLALAPPQSPAYTEGKGRGEDFMPHLGQALQT